MKNNPDISKNIKKGGIYVAAVDILIILAGTLVYALAIVVFIRPLNMPLGGVTGIALVLNYLWGLPVGTMVIIANIPLFLLSVRYLGRQFLAYTLIATVVSSVLLDVLDGVSFLPRYGGEEIMGALYGGLLMGAGLGTIFSRGATAGGSDILSKLIGARTDFSLGRINLVLNAVVIIFAAIIYKSMEAALYAMVIQYVSSVTIDGILTGMDNSSTALIITHDPDGISAEVLSKMKRGVTMLSGKGMYTHSPRATLLCVVRSHEVTSLKKLVMKQDPEAFVVMLSTREVLGKGFKSYGQ